MYKPVCVIYDNKIKDNIKIVQITDLHGAKFGLNNSFLLNKIDKEKPDIVVVTGDMYTYGSETGKKVAADLMKRLTRKYKTYYVNGEHDNNEEFKKELLKNNVHVMDYKKENLKFGDTEICLYGINTVNYSSTYDLNNEFKINDEKYNILLAHIENKKAFTDFGIDLSICGDTHGGQVRLPLLGEIYDNSSGRLFEEKINCETFVKGLYEYNGKKIFVSSGLGNYPIPVRLFNRPEIAVIKLCEKQ